MSNSIANSSTMNLLPVQAYFNADGTFNTFVGQGQPFTVPFSGNSITNATINNSSIGATTPSTGAFTSLSSTADATIHGLTVGLGGGAGATNTVVGNGSFVANSTGAYNSAFGYLSLPANTTGRNTAYGSYSLYTNTTGNLNTAIGDNALALNTTGGSNVSIGYQALNSNTTASNNTAVGYQAGYSNTTGTYNTFIGNGAGYQVTSGAKNTILGGYNGNQSGLDIRTASNYIVLSDGDGNPRQVIDSSGNLLFGQTTTGGGPSTGGIQLRNTSVAASLLVSHQTGVGNGNSFAEFFYGSAQIGSIVQTTTSVVTYNTTSDYRLKNVIGTISDSGSRIDALEPIEYEWKADGLRTRGFLAHQFQEVYANSVHGEKDSVDAEGKPVYQSMQASTPEVIADLIAEIQSLRKRVAQLESK